MIGSPNSITEQGFWMRLRMNIIDVLFETLMAILHSHPTLEVAELRFQVPDTQRWLAERGCDRVVRIER